MVVLQGFACRILIVEIVQWPCLRLGGCDNAVVGKFFIVGQISGSMAGQIDGVHSGQKIFVFGNVE
jgi:hypothetical protein